MKQPKLSTHQGKGWYGESTRHDLSRQGIKTGKRSAKPIYTVLGGREIQEYVAKGLQKEGIFTHVDTKKLERIKRGQTQVYGFIEGGRPAEKFGTPIITAAKELPKTRFGKYYHKVRYGHEVPTRKSVLLHETLHYYHPEKGERSIAQLERHAKKRYLRWWER